MVKTEEDQIIQLDTAKAMSISPTSSSSSRKRKYKGVRMRSWGSWVSEIRAPNQKTRIWLGSYSTAEAAARAYDAALLCLKGSSANFNFPISTPPYVPDTIMSPKSIQRVAAAAAAAADNNATTTSTTSTTTTSSAPKVITTTPLTPPPLSLSTTSSPSSSSSNLFDDNEVPPLIPNWASYSTTSGNGNEQEWYQPSPIDPWIDFDTLQSPKYTTPDQMLNACNMFAPPTMEDFFYEEGDIPLWSFC
ncbi:hypothetical protein ACHQM5_022730 [Ranunculus cassubicifolius]